MGAIRTLYTDLKLRSDAALKGLVAYGRQWKAIERVVANTATSIEKNADRAAAAMARMSSGAATMRGAGGGGGGARATSPRASTGGAGRKGGDDLDKAIARANTSAARQSGLTDGARAIKDATAALGPFATKSERAKAAVADLAAQVARNRKELADLRAEAVKNGDESGRLKARMEGMSTATGQASVALSKARSELRAIDGGFLKAVKSATLARVSVVALGTAFGNLITGAVSGAFRGVTASITGAAKAAIDFESAFADVKKVLPDGTTAEQIKGVEKSVIDLSRRVAVDGPEGAAKLNAALLQTGLYTTETLVPAAEAAAKIGVAFDIGAEEAGNALAKLRVGGNLTQEQVEKLAGTFNHLSNNMPATAKQIIEAEGRVISIGNAANISAEQTTALVTAMIATGADADVAATGTKNFIKALGSGDAATKKQRHAFKMLGLDARDVAKNLTAGGKSAETAVKDVVSRIGELGKTSREKVLPVLIELFGSESISSIGPLATNIDLLTKSFDLAGDSVAAANSVEKEYESRSKTTANAIQLLKNNVSALAIEFGNALLPYINEVVAFLTSPEGQEWGRGAVEKAVGAVTSLASALGTVVSVFGSLSESLGTTATAIGAVGIAALALAGPAGPFAAVALAGVAAGAAIVNAFTQAQQKMTAIMKMSNDISAKQHDERQKTFNDEIGAEQKGQDEMRARRAQAQDLADRYYRAKGKGKSGDDLLKVFRESNQLRTAVEGNNRLLGGGTEDDRLANLQQMVDSAEAGTSKSAAAGRGRGGDQARFDELSAKVSAGKSLRPSEATEYTALSKSLDEAKAKKRGKGHKATKMDRQLAAMDPSVRGLLTRGGESDAGGDLKVSDDALSRAAYDRASKMGGGGTDRSDGAGIGPGPSIENKYDNRTYNIPVTVDARGRESSADNLRGAANVVATRTLTVLTGGARIKAERNSGGVLRGPG